MRADAYSATGSAQGRRDYLILVPLLLLVFLIAAKPVPLLGAADDFQYLTAAQCLDCLPTNHWARRFPIVWPTGISIDLFGINFWSAMIAPVAASMLAVVLLYRIVEQQWGRTSALIAACVLCLTPVFADRSMRIGVDVIELALDLGAVFILQRQKPSGWAGILLALAVLSRPTQLAAVPMIGFLAWRLDRAGFKSFVLGLAGPLALEAMVYLISTGDPLYSWKLSLHHANHPTAYLDDRVDYTKSPIFNPDFIGGWKPISGIHTHWAIQGFVNLMLSSQIAPTLWASLIFLALSARRLDRLQCALTFCAIFWFGAMVYAFGVDPKPRMFMPVIAIAAALIGSLAPTLWTGLNKIAVSVWLALILGMGIASPIWRTDFRLGALRADELLREEPYETTAETREHMALIRRDFPSSGKHLLQISNYCWPDYEGRPLIHSEPGICIYR